MDVILNNGVRMPSLGLGTYRLQSPTVEIIVESALELGYKLLDTAQVYRNEIAIGEVLKKSTVKREDIFVTSKLGPSQQGTEGSLSAAHSSLKNLQLDYLDLFLIHWPGITGLAVTDPQNAKLRLESWKQLEELYKQGKFKAIGVSNYTVQHLEELLQHCEVVPAVLQVEIHPYLTQPSLREFCAKHNIHVQAYSSLGSGQGCDELLKDPIVQQVAQEHNRSSAQILLRWALDHGMAIIPKTSIVERLKENMDIFDFSLTPLQLQKLDSLDQNKHYCWNPNGVK